jgi:hypothetical protein
LHQGWKPVRVEKRVKSKISSPVSIPSNSTSVALCGVRRYIPRIAATAALRRRSEKYMRAEVERLVEEIKQSVGLLRRHL